MPPAWIPMHPAPSLIAFSTLSGLGFGLLAWLGVIGPEGWVGAVFHAIGLGLASAGLVSSAFHLGNPQRAPRAFTQWRSSWLSREAWLAVAALGTATLHGALSAFGERVAPLGWAMTVLCLGTVLATSMIYASIRAVPRWHAWTTPAAFLAYAVAGGALLAGQVWAAPWLLIGAGALQLVAWARGDGAFARAGSTVGTATGLGSMGRVRPFEPPHTGSNYLLDEMVFRVGRKHARRLRVIGLGLAAAVPAALTLLPSGHALAAVAVVAHLGGVVVLRWLFFAQAEHVVGLYYGERAVGLPRPVGKRAGIGGLRRPPLRAVRRMPPSAPYRGLPGAGRARRLTRVIGRSQSRYAGPPLTLPPAFAAENRPPDGFPGAAHPFTAPAVSPLTIWRWNTITRRNSGAVIETAAAMASTWSVVVVSRLK